jgi:L-lactate dehydrogenase complex protein LldE
MRIALFVTCLNDTLFPATGVATVRLLERLGHRVEFPPAQTCCGQLHFNSGYQAEALGLARRFVRTFADAEVVAAPSGSCAAMVHEFYPYLAEQAGDASFAREVAALAPRVLELSQLLVGRLGVEDVGASFPQRVVYHPTCHSLRLLRVGDAPLRLLRAVGGLELAELPAAEECCGFGGTFAVKNADTSSAMVADKVDAILGTGADVVAALDNSCLMNIGGALSRRGARVRPLHLAEILA